MKQQINRILVAAGLIFLAGCASQVNMNPTVESAQDIVAERGIVVARVVNAGSFQMPFNQLTLTPENLNASKTIKPERLTAKDQFGGGYTVFAAQVPPGTYMVSDVRSFYIIGDYIYSKFVSAPDDLGTFTVEAGQITDIGTLVHYPKSMGEKYQDILLRVPEQHASTALDAHFAFLNERFNKPIGWNEDGLASDRELLFSQVVQSPVSYTDKLKLSDGSVLFFNRLGTVLERDPAGNFSAGGVTSNLAFTDVKALNAGGLVVAAPEGKVFHRDAGKQWHDWSLDADLHVHAVRETNEGAIDVLTSRNDELIVFRRESQVSTWREMNRYNYIKGWTSLPRVVDPRKSSTKKIYPRRILSANFFSDNDQTWVKITTQSMASQAALGSGGEPVYFRFNSVDWTVEEFEDDPDDIYLMNAGLRMLKVERSTSWWSGANIDFFRKDQSTDSWVEISRKLLFCKDEVTTNLACTNGSKAGKSKSKSFYFNGAPLFSDDLNAVASVSVSNYDFWTSERSSESYLVTTNDGGQTWANTGKAFPKEYCTALVPEVTDRLLISCNGATLDFYESLDQGASWQQVRFHEEF